MTDPRPLSKDELDSWVLKLDSVALVLRQKLLPIEGEDGIVFPPTYAKIGYNVDTLEDGTKVALMDSVGSQANRIEPIFSREPFAELVPQIQIRYGEHEDGAPKTLSLLEVGHRLGDAVVRSSGPSSEDGDWDLAEQAKLAFESYLDRGDATHIAKISPTSLVFGVWDSRDTEAKLPRILQSTIRAWNVSELHRSAQYVPALNYAKEEVFPKTAVEKAEGSGKDPLAQRGFVHVPSTDALGGIVVHGGIYRNVTVNLVALRRLDSEDGNALRRYILGLTLVAAGEPLDPFLRQGCILTPDPDAGDHWQLVDRKGKRTTVSLDEDIALEYARNAANDFGIGPNHIAAFDKKRAVADGKKKK